MADIESLPYIGKIKNSECEIISLDKINNNQSLAVKFVDNKMNGKIITVDTSRAKSNKHVVSMCAKNLGILEIQEPSSKPCNIYWHNVVYSDLRNVIPSPMSYVNKFPGMTELAKKISLTKSLKSMEQLFPSEYTFYPQSWIIPPQLEEFKKYIKDNETKWFISKPDDGAQGSGIYLLNKFDDLKSYNDRQLIQEYIINPFLMNDNLKFDFRIYAVLRSINPLSIYVAREGMVRFCTEKYKKPTKDKNLNLYSHLTNYSLNKNHTSYKHSNSLKDQIKGSKRLLSTVFHQMEKRGMNTRRLWHNIKIIIVKTVIAMLPEIMLNYEQTFHDMDGPQCFQIMGFDIMVQDDGKPILLEVNAAPSLTIEHTIIDGTPPVRSIVDEVIKVPLVRDCLLLAMNILEEEYSSRSDCGSGICSDYLPNDITLPKIIDSNNIGISSSDDIVLTMKAREKKPHLSEIFPNRYGGTSGHLLFLDKAVYLYMQFINIKVGTKITLGGIRNFIRKCNLIGLVSDKELGEKLKEIQEYYIGNNNDTVEAKYGYPFHGFLQILFYFAEIKFSYCESLLSSMQRLLVFCNKSLQKYGVQSARLRRTEIEKDENNVYIYLLPQRMKRGRCLLKGASMSRSKSESTKIRVKDEFEKNIQLPRTLKVNNIKLPKI
ncbi:Tubulin polyglutamylase TTLL11 [Strongyloides ratti]|uniref:Tubulin polyglutamylase TTLL11 n=1 Tax=Strongyloides ratti TaxID=34506 RepID=A0A090L300_STRRB|nr:Tubulin polyglutamylase TTLL11 [Strongyloides ratti]CEF61849.1 Tubulin polyglutamylase TTLL11 [Strongyloides ratti]